MMGTATLTKSKKDNKILSPSVRLFLFIVAVLYATLSFVTSFYIDDWMFMAEWVDYAGSEDFSLPGFIKFMDFIRGYDNGRIANLLSPFTTLFSPFKEIYPVLNGIVYAILILLIQKLAAFHRKGPELLLLSVAWFAIIIFLPWYDNILITDYTLNYVWSSMFSLLFLYLLLNAEKNGWSVGKFITVFIVAFFASGFHEGFASSTFCGLGLMALFRRFRLSPQFYLISGFFLINGLIFMLSTGITERIAFTTSSVHTFPGWRIFLVEVVLLIFVATLCLSCKGRKIIYETLRKDITIVCIGIAVSGIVIGLNTVNAPRCFFYPDLAIIIILISLLNTLYSNFRQYFEARQWFSQILTAVIIVLCVLQTSMVIYWQKIFSDETEKVYALIKESDTGMIYYDFQHFEKTPRVLLTVPRANHLIWNSEWQFGALNRYFKKPMLSVVPTFLNSVDPKTAVPVPGTLKALNANGFLIVRDKESMFYHNAITPKSHLVKYKLQNSDEAEKSATFFPFIPEGRTDTLYYLTIPLIDANTVTRLNIGE